MFSKFSGEMWAGLKRIIILPNWNNWVCYWMKWYHVSLLELCNSLGQAKLTDSLKQQQCKLDFCTHDQIVCLEFMARVLKNKVFSFYFVLIRLVNYWKTKLIVHRKLLAHSKKDLSSKHCWTVLKVSVINSRRFQFSGRHILFRTKIDLIVFIQLGIPKR